MKLASRMIAALLLALMPAACESAAPARRNVEVIYRFENLRKQPSSDEWAAIKPILDRASTKPITVQRSGVRTVGTMQIANYEARCILPTLGAFERVQAELDTLAAREPRGSRIETYLSGVSATYKSNFVVATVNIAVSGVAVTGHRIRVFSAPGEPPVETTAGAAGVWVVRLAVLPQTQWVYGLSEDPSGRIPTRYFRINIATRQQETIQENEFTPLFVDTRPISASPARDDVDPARSAAESAEDRAIRERREKEDEAYRKRRDEEERRRRAPDAGPKTAPPPKK